MQQQEHSPTVQIAFVLEIFCVLPHEWNLEVRNADLAAAGGVLSRWPAIRRPLACLPQHLRVLAPLQLARVAGGAAIAHQHALAGSRPPAAGGPLPSSGSHGVAFFATVSSGGSQKRLSQQRLRLNSISRAEPLAAVTRLQWFLENMLAVLCFCLPSALPALPGSALSPRLLSLDSNHTFKAVETLVFHSASCCFETVVQMFWKPVELQELLGEKTLVLFFSAED